MNKQHIKFRYGWSSWLILVIAFITVFFHRLSVGSVADNLTKEIPMNSLVLGNLTAMNYYAYALMQIPVGILVDLIGVRLINLTGLLITALGSLLFGLTNSIELAYLSRFLVGIGTSVIIVSILKVQATWFPLSRFSTLSGFTSFLGNFGAFLAIYPLSYLSVTWGWRQVFFLMAGISLVLAFAVFWGVRDAKPQPILIPHSAVATGEHNSLFLDQARPSSFRSFLVKALKSVLGNPRTWPNVLILFAFTGSSTTLLGLWGIPLLTRIYDLNKTTAAGYLTFATLGFILGAPLVSLWARFLGGNRRTLLVSTALNFLLWLYIVVITQGKPPQPLLPVLFFFFGFLVINHLLAFSNVTEVNSLEFSGIASAVTNMGEFIGSSLASLVIGFMLDKGLSAAQTLWVFLMMAILSFTGALFIREPAKSTVSRSTRDSKIVATKLHDI